MNLFTEVLHLDIHFFFVIKTLLPFVAMHSGDALIINSVVISRIENQSCEIFNIIRFANKSGKVFDSLSMSVSLSRNSFLSVCQTFGT